MAPALPHLAPLPRPAINCASAIFPQATEDFNARRFNLMFEVGPRGSMLTAKHCIPHLKESAAKGNNPHILNLSPPIVTSGIGQANYMINKLGMTIGAISISAVHVHVLT